MPSSNIAFYIIKKREIDAITNNKSKKYYNINNTNNYYK